nr:unnamed protein product [Spirometra erinaceieuropaei]
MPISSLLHAPAVAAAAAAAGAAAAAAGSAAPDASSGCRLPAAVCTTIMPTSVICISIAKAASAACVGHVLLTVPNT